ncbi:MAG TPA: alpha-ketoglutarate-dependent dioxygenase AlkB [Stellaceae bacterium]|jgi:alkylated DNA repair dioxygenase AlkB|nr:alpha-ketoglutarate-dependent dioxygenase AlkB [Stellaceae bacterium]
MATDVFGAGAGWETVLMPDADVHYLRHLPLRRSDRDVLRQLTAEIAWRQEEIALWGRKIRQPRLTAWYGDSGRSYAYSGVVLQPLPWTPILLDIKTRVEQAAQSTFNSVLLNSYRDGRDGIGFHSDDEPELGKRPVIASLSLGEERTFVLKHKTLKSVKPVHLQLASGSLLLMRGDTQHCWRHGISKEIRHCDPRINLTFRRIID